MVGTQFQTHKKCNHSYFLRLLLVIWDVITNKLLPRRTSRSFYLCFLLGILVSSTWFKSSAHFKIIYMCGIDLIAFLHMNIKISQHHLSWRLYFPYCIFLIPLSKISWLWMYGLFMNSVCFIGHVSNKWDHIKLISFWTEKEDQRNQRKLLDWNKIFAKPLLLDRIYCKRIDYEREYKEI